MRRTLVAHEPTTRALGMALAAALVATVVARLLAEDIERGAAVVAVLVLAPAIALDLALGLGVWAALVFIQGIPALNVAENTLSGLLALVWLAALSIRSGPVRVQLRRLRLVLWLAAAFALWTAGSIAWADNPDLALADLRQWAVALYVLPIIATALNGPRDLRLLVAGYVTGAVVSVVLGLADGGLGDQGGGTHLQRSLDPASRLAGGERDPNFLAAGLVPALALAGGLLATTRGALARVALIAAMVLLGVGLAATASRGGLVAAGVSLLAALVLMRRRRAQLLAVSALAAGAVAAVMVTTSGIWERVLSSEDSGGSGRLDLWTIGARMARDEPLVGVGLNNFGEHASQYARLPGELEHGELVTEVPHVVHNLYLQALAETGVVGLALLLALLVAVVAAGVGAARRFELRGESSLATLTQAAVVATIGMLAAGVFLSNGADKRLWLLLALGPALAAMAPHTPGSTIETRR